MKKAHKLRAILFTAISTFIGSLQLVSVLAMLQTYRHLHCCRFFLIFLGWGWSCMNACSVSSDIMELDMRVTISELLTGFCSIWSMNRCNIYNIYFFPSGLVDLQALFLFLLWQVLKLKLLICCENKVIIIILKFFSFRCLFHL